MFDVLGLYAFYSLEFTFGKAALQYIQPLFLISMRMLVSGPLLLAYVYFFKRKDFRIERIHWPLFVQAIIFQIYLGYLFDFWSLQFMDTGKNVLIFTLAPFITALIAYVLYSEKLSRQKIIGLSIGFIGVMPVLLTKTTQESSFFQIGLLSWPEIVAIAAVGTIAYGWIVVGRLTKEHNYSPLMINGISMFIGGLLILCSSPFLDSWNPRPFTAYWPFFTYTVFLIIVSNLITYNWYSLLLCKYTATFIAFVSFTEPLYVALYSWIWLGETVTWHFFVSLGLIILGLYLFYKEELGKIYVRNASTSIKIG